MNKKAFTLIEIAIVVTIIGIMLGTFLNVGLVAIEKQKNSGTKGDLEAIKSSIIAYASVHSRLPYPDIDGDGRGDEIFNCVSDNCELPYLDIGAKAKDSFGMPYKYDVSYDLTTTNSQYELCAKIQSRFNYTTTLPSVVNDAGDNNYSVAAVVLSMGEDKELTGENSFIAGVNDRNYAMSQNRYHETDNNDILLELTPYELLANVCDMVPQYNANSGLEIYASLDSNVSGSAELAGGIITGGAALVTAGGATYLDFDETIPTEIRISTNKTYIDWTVSIWLQTDWNDNDRKDFVNLTNTNAQDVNIFIENGDLQYVNNPADIVNTNSNFNGIAWKHIVITHKRLSATQVEMKMYEDGSEIYTITQDSVEYDLNLGDFDLGGVGANAWDGSMDEFRFYNYAMDGDNITQYYDDTKAAHGH